MGICPWSLSPIDEAVVIKYAKEWQVSEVCAAILYQRGFRDSKEVENFLNFSDELDPFEFTDMKKAVDYLNEAIKSLEKICVYGDYDADGITATALLYRYLKSKTENVIYYIPDRDGEGYGLNLKAIDKLHGQGVKIIVTVDNGISAYEEIKYAVSLGMNVIITDHHQLPEKLPNSKAIINPCREVWREKFKDFAGVGVACKLVEAMTNSKDYLDLALLGTIGDSMPLFGQSRTIVKRGLESIKNSKIKGLKILFENLGFKNKPFDSIDLAFKVVPRINASGRMSTAEMALKLFVSEDDKECEEICEKLEYFNNVRKSTEQEIIFAVEEKIKQDKAKKFEKIIIVAGEDWHHGVLGIVASRITQKYGKPCILISFSKADGLARGSCRSVEGFSIYDMILSCSEYLDRFGGHTMAAGINLKTENVESFSNAVLEKSRQHEIDFPKIYVDLELNSKLISTDTLNSLKRLKPFGSGNPEPIFLIKDVILKRIIPIGNGNHLKLVFHDNNSIIEMFYFNKKYKDFLYRENERLDVLITLHSNLYKSGKSVSVYILDLKLSEVNIDEIINHKKIYEKFKRKEKLKQEEVDALLPTREEFIKVYRFLKNSRRQRVDIISHKIFKTMSYCGKIYIILEVLETMGLINLFWEADEFNFTINRCEKKVNLEESEVLFSLNKLKGVK